MKLLALLLGGLAVALIALPAMVFVAIATYPWLALTGGSVQVAAPPPATAPVAAPPAVVSGPLPAGLGDVIAQAETWLGVPYVFGGCSRSGVDCSCLAQLVYRAVGVSLPRIASDQFNATARLAREDLQPGDLVFFANTYMPGISHVGIYLGGGLQINAPTEGEVVSVAPVFSGYWGAHYAGAGRVRH